MKFKILLAISFLFTFLPFYSQAESAPEIPVYGENGRSDTQTFMEEVTKKEIDKTITVDEKGRPDGGGYYGMQMEAAGRAIEQAKLEKDEEKPPKPHMYDMGAEDGEIEKNHEHDKKVVLNDETFIDCMNYEIPGVWVKKFRKSGDLAYIPYVKYYGPPQKVENVDQPFRTGYFSKDDMKKMRNALEEGDSDKNTDPYLEIADEIADAEIAYATYVQAYQSFRRQKEFKAPEGSNVKDLTLESAIKHWESSLDPYKWPGDSSKRKEIINKAIDELKKLPKEKRYKNRDGNGMVYNEYHVLPSGLDLKVGEAAEKSLQEPLVWIAGIMSTMSAITCEQNGAEVSLAHPTFPHITTEAKPYYSEAPEHILISRYSPASFFYFPNHMFMRAYEPESCLYFNLNTNWKNDSKNQSMDGIAAPKERRKNFDEDTPFDNEDIDGNDAFHGTPADMLRGLIIPKPFTNHEVCQGMNQGSWLPVINTVHTPFHTTAAAIGTVRGLKIGAAYYPYENYSFAHDNHDLLFNGSPNPNYEKDGDKVQWSQNKHMDGPPNEPESEERQCRSVERWVLKYGMGNLKQKNPSGDPQEAPEDYWNVVNHWRYWRGEIDPCPSGEGVLWDWVSQLPDPDQEILH